MIKQIICLAFLSFGICFKSAAQCSYTSSDGYTVNIYLSPTAIVNTNTTSQPCPSVSAGYTYRVEYGYRMEFTGPNQPSNLWTTVGSFTTDQGSHFFNWSTSPTPSSGVSGQLSAPGGTRNATDCATVTTADVNLTSATITVQGPGLSITNIVCPLVSFLPVEFMNVDINRSADGSVLTWGTASELNNSHFEVQRQNSGDGEWITLGRVEGNGTTQEKQYYTFLDENAPAKRTNYRVKQIDFDGSHDFSLVVQSSEIQTKLIILKPNPVNSILTVNCDLSKVGFQISTASGEVLTDIVKIESFDTKESVINVQSLKPGLYFFTVNNSSYRFIKY